LERLVLVHPQSPVDSAAGCCCQQVAAKKTLEKKTTFNMSTFIGLFMALLLALVSSKPTTETDIVAEILKAIDGRDEMWRVTSYLKESRDDLVKELPLVSPGK
jgi:uncharacterized membrane protein YgaE (UPF0421/DUF939 family)